ncbi:hypothetical protein Hanom_Chr11g01024301 [Helianthus anomalus]
MGGTGANIRSCGARMGRTWAKSPVGKLGCHTVMAPAMGSFEGGLLSIRTLKNVMLIRLVGDWDMAWRAMSALFPLITKSDLLNCKANYHMIQ